MSKMTMATINSIPAKLQTIAGIEERAIQCVLCQERFRQPKSLPCFHSYCLECLEQWVSKTGNSSCPVCREHYPIPDAGLEEIEENSCIVSLLSMVAGLEKEEEAKCVVCERDAEYNCKDCKEFLCTGCMQMHRRLPVTRDHILLPLEEYKQQPSRERLLVKPSPCPTHKTLPLKFFCDYCRVPVCTECTVVTHKGETHRLRNIDDAFTEFSSKVVGLRSRSKDARTNLEDAIDRLAAMKLKLKNDRGLCLKKIQEHENHMHHLAKQCGQILKQNLESTYTTKDRAIDAQVEELELALVRLTNIMEFTDTLSTCPDKAAALVSSEEASKRLEHKTKNLPPLEPYENGFLDFVPDEEPLTLLNKKSLGVIAAFREESMQLQIKDIRDRIFVTRRQAFTVTVTTTDLSGAKKVTEGGARVTAVLKNKSGKTISVTITDRRDGEYDIRGECADEGNWMLEVNIYGRPIKGSPVLVTAEQEGIVGTVNLSTHWVNATYKVRGIMVNKFGDVLACNDTNQILEYDKAGGFRNKISLTQGIRVSNISPLSSHGLLAVADLSNKEVIICSPDGTPKRWFGKDDLVWPLGTVADEASGCVFVVDRDAHCFVKFSLDGRLLGRFGSEGSAVGHLKYPRYCALTRESHVIISDWGNHRVQLFDSEGNVLKVLVEGGQGDGRVWGPEGVVVDRDGNIIVASTHKLQLFDSHGKFVKRIDKREDGLNYPMGLSLIPNRIRQVTVANSGNNTYKSFNY
ncbi:tripartite motif-containing protein 2-like [Anneissia japonica]|uniref:tripartite motif-containing protein 2-like n=1 Tax=Anneissia japonica TaxID=1529436 RepID=UPI0014255E8D|nr:tripartite motif-containing protein 2-like [Anneissia japonica]